jgi:hypothetical protein
MVNKWIEENYDDILQWAKNACQQNKDWEDLAHYAIMTFLEHHKAEELVMKGHARWFIVRILLNSSRGEKSEYYRLYRPKWQEIEEEHKQIESEEYDLDIDLLTEWVNGILEDMLHGDADQWYRSTIFTLCIQQDRLNFSKLARETGIPRTSIANAYYESIDYVKNKLLEYGTTYHNISRIIDDYFNAAD